MSIKDVWSTQRLRFDSLCFVLALTACLGMGVSRTMAVDKKIDTPNSRLSAKTISSKSKPFIGLNVVNLNTVNGQDSSTLNSPSYGVLVETVHPESPAAIAGIRSLDVLLSYDDQKLFNCDQVIKLIAMDRPGREVKIRLTRNDRPETVRVRLGDRPAKFDDRQTEVLPRDFPKFDAAEWQTENAGRHAMLNQNPTSWKSTQSLVIKRLDRDRFRVTLIHAASKNELIKHEYEGTRDELRKKVKADEGLEENERQQLLEGLGMQEQAAMSDRIIDDLE